MDTSIGFGRAAPDKAITVVGAGPAGLACAIALSRAGRRVTVREWHKSVGARFHDDFQGLENWSGAKGVLEELAEAGVEPTFDHHPVSAGVAYDAWGKRYEVRSGKPLYYLVRRGPGPGTLDHALLHQAEAAGVEVRFGDRVEGLTGPAVLAIGPRSADAIATGYVFDTTMPDGTWICFDNALAPRGYSYLLIHDGHGTVASCMFSGFKQHAAYVSRTVEAFRQRVGLEMRNPRPFGGFANFRLPRTAVQNGRPVIGEQAGFQDALAGFGMRYALQSARLAARSLTEGVDYTQLWRTELRPLLRTSVSNRYIFNLVGNRGWRWLLKNHLSGADAGLALRRLYQPSLTSRLMFPLAWWRFRAPLGDKSCRHIDCSCVWCRVTSPAESQGTGPCAPAKAV